MKIKLMLPLLGVLALAASPLHAQDETPTSKPQVSAPYKLAVGFRYASGPAGLDLGITAKYFIRDSLP
jgi:hypothetical protein